MSGAMNALFSGFSQGGCCGWFLGVGYCGHGGLVRWVWWIGMIRMIKFCLNDEV